ncbi:MAG: hypothetical protein P8L85_24355, partial [Rubripirellula sp.]|nr:hypothetical protein [Rubripirellula sp.]
PQNHAMWRARLGNRDLQQVRRIVHRISTGDVSGLAPRLTSRKLTNPGTRALVTALPNLQVMNE